MTITDDLLVGAVAAARNQMLLNLPAAEECQHSFSEQFKSKMKKLIKWQQHNENRRRMNWKLIALVAIIAILMTVSVLAASGFFSGILDYFKNESGKGLTQEQETMIQAGTAMPEQRVTTGGVTITLKEVYGDGIQFWFYLSLESKQDISKNEIFFEENHLHLNGVDGGYVKTVSVQKLTVEHTNNYQTEVMLMMTRKPAENEVISEDVLTGTLELQNLIDWADDENRGNLDSCEVVASGVWTFEFQLKNVSSSRVMKVENFTISGNAALNKVRMDTANVESIKLTSLGMEMIYKTAITNGDLDFSRPVVVLEDGSEIVLIASGGGAIVEQDGSYIGRRSVSYEAEGPFMLDRVAAIRFGDQTLTWKPD